MLQIDDNKKNDKNVICHIIHKDTRELMHYVHLDEKNADEISSIELNEDYITQCVPYRMKERDVYFVCGMAGSGKSYFIKNYTLQYIKMFPKRLVYLFSYKDEDKELDSVGKIQRINWNTYDFLSNAHKLSLDEWANSMVIFDDIDSIENKNSRKVIYAIVFKLLKLGRSYNINVMFGGHDLFSGTNETKILLNESTHITVFPLTLGDFKLERLLKGYLGYSTEQIKYIKSIVTRPLTFIKGYPKILIADRNIKLC